MAEGSKIAWPCTACGATSPADAYNHCLDDTGHNDCAHNVLTTPCPMDDLLEETD